MAAALLDRLIWRERGVRVKMVSAASGASDQGLWGVYRCILSWGFQWDNRRPCPTSVAGDIANLVKRSFGGLRGLWSGSLRCLWMHLFKPVPRILSVAMSDNGGRIYHRLFTAAALSARTYVITWDCSHWPLNVGGKRGWLKLAVFSRRRSSLAAVTSSESSFLSQCRPH